MPDVRPKFFTIESPGDSYPAWPVVTWWLKSAAAR